ALLARGALPDQLVASVSAHVVEGADLALHVARDDHGGLGGRQLLREVGAIARELFDPPDIEPCALEDRLALELVGLGRDRVLVRDESGSELRVLLGPAAPGRLHAIDSSPASSTRRITRRVVGSYFDARCIVPRLSQINASPGLQVCR